MTELIDKCFPLF